ncbi:hypothetical protein [Photobacterium leiognathi]|uniref:hypothetical protein n=1 Tax=Photobacterium leiognathi TaxID=553611 RepID=UPI00298188CF|nr:hypothetical protein [Photobacterium leiognathi]
MLAKKNHVLFGSAPASKVLGFTPKFLIVRSGNGVARWRYSDCKLVVLKTIIFRREFECLIARFTRVYGPDKVPELGGSLGIGLCGIIELINHVPKNNRSKFRSSIPLKENRMVFKSKWQ